MAKDFDDRLLQELRRLKAPGCPPDTRFDEYLVASLLPEETGTLEAHLRACPWCVNRLIDFREVNALAQEEEELPSQVVNEQNARIATAHASARVHSSFVTRMTAVLRELGQRVWEWTSPRMLGNLAGLAATALLALMIWNSFLRERFSPGGEIPLFLLTPASQQVPSTQRLVSDLDIPVHPHWQREEGSRGQINEDVYEQAARATVAIVTEKGVGSGAVISAQGEVLTNWHVVQGTELVVVAFKPKGSEHRDAQRGFTARVVKVDPTTDLALVRIDAPPSRLVVLPLGSLRNIIEEQDAYAIGHPAGNTWTYTPSLIRRVSENFQWKSGEVARTATVILTQSQRNPGNSGGPLLNDAAELIGLHSLRADETNGINYAVAIDTIKKFLAVPQPVAPPTPPLPPLSSYKLEQTETNIVGVYTDAAAPLPSSWLVYRDSARTKLAYAVKALHTPTRIDTVAVTEDYPAATLRYYFDTNCDGAIDLIGQSSSPSGTIERYELPTQPMLLNSLAEEFLAAVRAQTLGHNELRICQP
jgi:S1-C subfamily serine protease